MEFVGKKKILTGRCSRSVVLLASSDCRKRALAPRAASGDQQKRQLEWLALGSWRWDGGGGGAWCACGRASDVQAAQAAAHRGVCSGQASRGGARRLAR